MDPNQDILGPTNYYEKKITDTPIVSGYIETTNDEYDTNVEIIIKDDDGNTLGSDNLNSDGTFAVQIEFVKGGEYPIYAYCGSSVSDSDASANMTVYYLSIVGYNQRNYYPNAGSSLILTVLSNYDDSTLGNMSIYLNGGLFSNSVHKGDYEVSDEMLTQIGYGANITARVISTAVNLEDSVELTNNVAVSVTGEITLTGNKTILSAADHETLSLTAYLTDTIIENININFYKEGNNMTKTLIGTATTDANGVATITYESTGAGDVNIIAECESSSGTLVSEIYEVEDCSYYSTTEYKQNTDGITSNIALPSTFKLEYDITPTSRSTSERGSSSYLRIGADSNSGVWAGQLTSAGKHGLMPKPSGTTQYCTSNTVLNTANHITVVYDGSTVSYTCNNETVTLSASNLSKINAVVPTVNNGLKNIKVKPL